MTTSLLSARYSPNVALLLVEALAEPVQRGRAIAAQCLEDGFVVGKRQRCLDGDLPLDCLGDLVGRRRESLGSKNLRENTCHRGPEPDAGDTHALDATRTCTRGRRSSENHGLHFQRMLERARGRLIDDRSKLANKFRADANAGKHHRGDHTYAPCGEGSPISDEARRAGSALASPLPLSPLGTDGWPIRPNYLQRDNPPVGTEVLLGGGLVEIHVGRGIWQTVAA